MKGIKFSKKIIINCPPDEAFDYTQDYENRLEWDTFLKRAELVGGATKADTGVKAYCVAKNGLGMVTEYVSFNRLKATAIKMTQGAYMFKTFPGLWTFKDIGNLQTEVVFLYSFRLRFPFSLIQKIVERKLKSNVEQRLTNLKTNIESRSTNR